MRWNILIGRVKNWTRQKLALVYVIPFSTILLVAPELVSLIMWKKRVFFHYLSKGFTCFYANTSMCLHHKMSVQVLYGYLVPVAEMDTWEFYILYRNILPRESKLLCFISRRDTKGLTTIWDCQGKELKWKPSLEGKMGLHGNKEGVIKPLLSPIIQGPD